jgi:hypothetical protein
VDNTLIEQDKGGIQGACDEKRPVTLFSAVIIVIANMIGIGVFTTLGFQVASLHSPFAVLMLWVLGGGGRFLRRPVLWGTGIDDAQVRR